MKHANSDALAAIQRAMKSDPSLLVRKKAAWHAPGGAIYRHTRPAA